VGREEKKGFCTTNQDTLLVKGRFLGAERTRGAVRWRGGKKEGKGRTVKKGNPATNHWVNLLKSLSPERRAGRISKRKKKRGTFVGTDCDLKGACTGTPGEASKLESGGEQ